MFESISERFQTVFHELGRRGKLRPEDVDASLREIRLALLEADVNYQVVRDLLSVVEERALNEKTAPGLNPAQHMISIVHTELVRVLGEPGRLELTGEKPRTILLAGLQGSGKTTTAAKLSRWLRSRGERVWMIATDTRRPAAAEQLRVLGEQIDVPVFFEPGLKPADLLTEGLRQAKAAGASVALIDTAGRSQLDAELMGELSAIRTQVRPVESLLVADGMTGQEAVNIAQGFKASLQLSGLVLTKMDGDARGGAAISMRSVTGVPIKFIGTGEHLEDLEAFEPDRLASRILGMGDLKGLIESAATVLDAREAEKSAARLAQGEFTLEDFADQLNQVQRMGPLGKMLDLLPLGTSGLKGQIDAQAAQKQMIRTQAIIQSMTRLERQKPKLLNASRKRRIAAGSGTSVQEVNQLLRQFRQMQKFLKQMGKQGLGGDLSSRLLGL